MFWLPCPFFPILNVLSHCLLQRVCPGCPVPVVLYWLSYPGRPVLAYRPVCHVPICSAPATLFMLSWCCCPVFLVMSWSALNLSGRPVQIVMSLLSCIVALCQISYPDSPAVVSHSGSPVHTCCHVLAILSSPSCLECTIPTVLSVCSVATVLSWLSCPGCPPSCPTLLSWLGRSTSALLPPVTCPCCPVLAAMSSPSCPLCPVRVIWPG